MSDRKAAAGPGALTLTDRGLGGALTRYRVMALVVGVLLVVLVLVGVPLKYLPDLAPGLVAPDSGLQHLGEAITTYLGIAHGYLYMIFVLSAFLLSRKARWEMGFTLVTLLSGTVPLLSFWAERRATRAVLTEHPELLGSTSAP